MATKADFSTYNPNAALADADAEYGSDDFGAFSGTGEPTSDADVFNFLTINPDAQFVGKLFPPGIYNAHVSEVKYGRSQSGRWQFTVTYTCSDAAGDTVKVKDFWGHKDKEGQRLGEADQARILRALKVLAPQLVRNGVTPEDITRGIFGAVCKVRLKTEPSQDGKRTFNRVDGDPIPSNGDDFE